MVGVEPAPKMAALAKAKFADRAAFHICRLEDVELDGHFDAVVAFNAWHWVDPTIGLEVAAQLLDPGGALAVVWTDVVQWGQDPFEEVLATRLGIAWPKTVAQVSTSFDSVLGHARFDDVGTRRHRFTRTMDAPTFLAVSHTYGGNHLPEVDQVLTEIIDGCLGGEITKVEEAVLHVARFC